MSITSASEMSAPAANPIDLVEEIVAANEWAHERASDDEMFVEIGGRWCDYRLFFVWQPDMNALLFSCGFEMKVPRNRRAAVFELLSLVNEKLWLGHFDWPAIRTSPASAMPCCCAARSAPAWSRSRTGGCRAHRMRALLPGLPVRGLGRQGPGRGADRGDDRPRRRSVNQESA